MPLRDTVDSVQHMDATGRRAPAPGPVNPWGFFGAIICYVPISSTSTGFDTFTYTAIDVDDNESAPVSVTIEVFEVKVPPI
ncbi:hypothetical protein [Acidovorax sp. A79]|uniref:hypothetical protein n=1 Tax=Acidovorax sp. A79 TaxID=3056107 RepID=UPI0034E862EE